MEREVEVRAGASGDLGELVRIYNHYVEATHVTFDTSPFTTAEREAWFAQFGDAGPWRLVVAAGDQGRLHGYACSTAFKAKPAYAVSVETSVYVDPDALGRGVGRRLLVALLELLEGSGAHGAYAGIAQPNEASVALHESLGFRHVGTLREVGRKFERYWDVAWYERRIGS